MSIDIKKLESVLIFGASGGIGHALASVLLENNSRLIVYLHHRKEIPSENLKELKERYQNRVELIKLPLNQENLKKQSNNFINQGTTLDLIINTIAFLHDESMKPEKSLRDINEKQLAKSFFVNSTLTALIAQNFIPLIDRKKESAFVTISAKVGSISDNRMGGWYSYRASKAALNMIMKNISIELERKRSRTKVLTIHPGTTDTFLSKPFTKNTPYKLHSPTQSATNILKVICDPQNETGLFYSWDGSQITW